MATTALGCDKPPSLRQEATTCGSLPAESFSSRLLLLSFLVLFIVFDSIPATRFWGGNMEGTCLFVRYELLHRFTPQWTGIGHQCHSLNSLQPVNCLTDATSNRDNKRSYAAWMNPRGVGSAAWRTQQLPRSPVRFHSFHYHPLPIPYHAASDPSHEKTPDLSSVRKPPIGAGESCTGDACISWIDPAEWRTIHTLGFASLPLNLNCFHKFYFVTH